MLKVFSFARNVGSNVLRNSIRDDQQKSRLVPPNKFLFWFNEIPGKFSPPPHIRGGFLELEGNGGAAFERGVAPYVEFSQHNEDRHNFELGSLSYLRALHYGALLAVGYTVLHNKLLANIVREACEAYCPVRSVKRQKSALAQPLSSTAITNTKNDCQLLKLTDHREANTEELTTSDYSSTKSDFETQPEFTLEEEEILKLGGIPVELELLSQALRNVQRGNPDGMIKLQQIASSGCPVGLFYLGQVYEHGIKTTTNKAKARELYEEAAVRGSAEAKYNLGLFYLRGEAGQELAKGERRAQGLRLVREAASEGVAEAVQALAVEKSPGTEAEAVNVNKDDLDALVKMGMMLEQNVLSDKEDKFIALDFYRVAGELGHKSAKIRMRKLSQSLQSGHSEA